MSWAPNRQPVNMAKQPPLSLVPPQQPPLQQVGVVASSSSDHGIAAPFGSQPVWKPNFTQQQPMQPVQQPPPNNWTPNPVTNAFQQQENVLAPTHPQQNNNWSQQDFQTSAISRPSQSAMPPSGYFLNQDNFNKSQQQYPIIQPAYSPPQQFQQQSIQQPVELPLSASVASMSPVASVIPVAPVTYSRQSTQQMDNVQEATDYFDNKPINTNEGWGDWDWNDNNLQQQHHQQHEQQMQQQNPLQQMPQQHQQQQQQQQPQEQQLQDPLPVATSIIGNLQTNTTSIDDSFRIESNDNWQWGQTDGTTQQNDNLMPDDFQRNSQKPPLPGQYDTSDPPTTSNIQASVGFIPPPQLKIPTVQPALETILQQPIHESKNLVKPTNLPLNDVSNLSENTQTNNNIPSPVYVSQAKPVPKPPRQFASPPNTLSDAVNSIGPTTPPHAFQNRTDLQPSNVVTVPKPTSTSNPITLPPPILSSGSSSSTVSNNPFKRTGLPQHPRAGIVAPPLNVQPSNLVSPPALFYASPPPPPEDFANPSIENHEVIAPDNSEILHENQEIAPNNDRNEYLQTSHLSEIGGDHADVAFNIAAHEQYNEVDDFPPPGLSRLVLGQPENESRQVPGTEDDSSLNIERQADGEDTDPTQQMRSNFSLSSDNNQSNVLPNQIDIAGDRNLYLVPGESDIHEQRVVTGLENGSSIAAPVPPIQVEQRELELDGENIEDQHQPQQALPTSQHHHSHQHRPVSPVQNVRDEALDGANSLDRQVQGSKNKNQDIGSSMSQETNLKDLSNISTGNDESDQRDRHYNKTRRGGGDNDNKKRRPGQESKENRYESEESEFSSDRERRRFREGSVRSERDRERDSKERKRRDKREREVGGERDRERYRVDDRENRYREKFYRDREGKQGGRYVAGRYDADSKYETESSTRHDRRRGGDRGERGDRLDREAYEEYRRYRNYEPREERSGHERRGGTRLEGDRRRTDREYREDRGSRRHKESREKPRNEYEEYRKASSRNARESDIEKDSRIREKDPRYAGHSMYSGYSGYGYDPYAAYYYEQMVRTNPQAYSEWYKKYYGQAPAPESITNNGRESVHSGRSSANNEKDRYTAQHHPYIPHSSDYQRHYIPPGAMTANMASTSMNSTMNESLQHQNNKRCYGLSGGPSTGNLSQINQLSGTDYYASTAHTYYARSEYTESRPEKLSLSLVDPVNESTQDDPQRLTPHKFTSDHPIVSLGPGLMVTVKPNYSHNGISNVVKIFRMGINDATNKLFQSFPGPLVRGLTHKKTIIEFCEDQIRQGPYSAINRSRQSSTNSLSAVGQANKPSFTLMWNLLILLLRQNGMVVGTDIAELLIKNQQQFPYETPQSSITSNSNAHESIGSEEQKKSKENNPSDPEPELDESIADESDEQSSKTSSLSEDEITEKFRNYLLYGNVNEALEWATDKNLWGHALFLASKVDRRSHANVMMKFANKLSLNDPLQTLYQLMSGRTPSSVTSVLDEKWGDWRPHLSMILSNTSQKPELDRKAITTLGDSLLSRGDLFAAHFCYLMAQVGFSKYPEERNDTLLLQNSVRLVLLGSSHQREFEEFATNESIMMTEVYEYACALNDDKFSLVEFQPYKFLLASRMLDYGYQLKCLMYMEQISSHIKRDPSKYEPSFINQVYELADRLKYYDPVLEKTMDEILADESPNQNTDVPFDEQPWLQELRSLALENTVQSRSQDINQDYQQTSNVINQQFAEINRQFNELNLQYENTNKLMQEQPQPQQVQSEADPMQVQYNPQPEGSQIPQNEQAYPQFYNPIDGQSTNDVVTDGIRNVNGYMQPTQESYQQPSTQSIYNQENNQVYSTYDQGEQQNYWANQPQIQNDETALPTISMPNSQSQKSGSYDESSQPSESKNSDAKKSGNHGSSTTGPKSDSKNALKGGQSSNQNSGWFGGIWNKLSLKPKNQMILPDDKNPAIVWDADKKKWVNTDGEEQIEENLKPPPKMSDLIPRVPQVQQQHQQVLPHEEALQPLVQTMPTQSYDPLQTFSAAPAFVSAPAPGETPKPPSLQSNMFKMQRNRTLKNSYVDVFNPSGAPPKPTEQVLAPAVPPAAVPSGSFFVPGAVPSDGAYQQHQQSTQEGAPQFYNPNQFGGY